MNRKKLFVSNNSKNWISEIFQFDISRNIFEMFNLYIIYAFQFITCEVSVDAFSLLYSKLLHLLSLFCLFVLSDCFGASHWQFISGSFPVSHSLVQYFKNCSHRVLHVIIVEENCSSNHADSF